VSAGGAADLFRSTFGRVPEVITSAPGRVNLIGEHTDYNGGEVLPIAIAQRTWVAMGRSPGPRCEAISREFPAAGTFALDDASPAGQWWDYVHGTLRALRESGAPSMPVSVAVVSDVPFGAGLSSSAALEVATALAGRSLAPDGTGDTAARAARLAYRAEREFVGVSCGIMDQYASACAVAGQALRIWCDSGQRAMVPFDRTVLVIDTAVPRALRDSAFNERQRACARALARLQSIHPGLADLAHARAADVEEWLQGDERRNARHVVTETARVGLFVDALAQGASLGPLLAASHASLRDDYACSTPELDWVVDHAHEAPGVEGARLTGAGWGGCAIAVGEPDALAKLGAEVPATFMARWGHLPRTWLTRAHDGAKMEERQGSP
jgi:galactokinase